MTDLRALLTRAGEALKPFAARRTWRDLHPQADIVCTRPPS